MARKDFYDIKGLGEILPEEKQVHLPPAYSPPRAYTAGHRPKVNKRRNHGGRYAAITLLVGVVIIAGVAVLLMHKKSTPPKVVHSASGVAQPSSQTTGGTYVSNGSDLNLSFIYPAKWSVSPPSDHNSSDQPITLVSSPTSFTAANGSFVKGKVIMTIRPAAAGLSELNNNSPTAAQSSTQFAYTTPTPSQYQYPYLSYVHFANVSGAPTTFNEVIVTGTVQFSQGQQLSVGLLSGLDPIISATVYQCHTKGCSGAGATPVAISAADWANDSLFQQVQTIFSSMKLN